MLVGEGEKQPCPPNAIGGMDCMAGKGKQDR